MNKILLLVFTTILFMAFIIIKQNKPSEAKVVLSYSYAIDSDTSLIITDYQYVYLNQEQAIRFLLDSLSNENILVGFELRFHRVRALVNKNGIILNIENISNKLVPYLLQLFEDKKKDWAANILLYHKSRCIGANLRKFDNQNFTNWQDSGEWLEDYEKWKNWDWENNFPEVKK